jgi:hypothetical protein
VAGGEAPCTVEGDWIGFVVESVLDHEVVVMA